MKKISVDRRTKAHVDNINSLFDISICKHIESTSCDCKADTKVPEKWKFFLNDQRTSRNMFINEVDKRQTEEEAKEEEKKKK